MTTEQETLLKIKREQAETAYRAYLAIMHYVNELERRYEIPETPIEGQSLEESIALFTDEVNSLQARLIVTLEKLKRKFA